MTRINTDSIREIAKWLGSQSISSNADPYSSVTKRDIENLRNNVAKAISAVADALDD